MIPRMCSQMLMLRIDIASERNFVSKIVELHLFTCPKSFSLGFNMPWESTLNQADRQILYARSCDIFKIAISQTYCCNEWR
ncbi:hypothetical protein TRFO_42917 [Tritrichomonas foetus]|uniref:Uncharacterized protein n=1 Tax=Tritrichomonas foetus TaxID=1144522 RepID=A0A1J4KY77_9EUKA|nr:hypothetical protein TRFO_42917 [Tritrichomonas foetus]|eukprot:OHT14660.1 hypothetical protein TRFO_42917 [Tritrichomonas foetus]